MEEEYDIPSQVLGKDVESMCNLGEGIWEDALENGYAEGVERGIEQGIKQGVEQGIKQGVEQGIEQGREETQNIMIQNMYSAGISIDKIQEITKKTEGEICEILKTVKR